MLRVDVEWRKGPTGMGGTYSFYPRPSLLRPHTGQKIVEFKVPLMEGSITQQLGKDSERFVLHGFLVTPDGPYDDLDEKRRDLESGVDVTQEGQLHIISNLGNPNSEHIFYNGLPLSIIYEELTNSRILEYRIEILLSDPTENVV